jgi:hypothetical protein
VLIEGLPAAVSVQLAGIAGGLGQGTGFIIVAIVLLLVGGFLSFKSNSAD